MQKMIVLLIGILLLGFRANASMYPEEKNPIWIAYQIEKAHPMSGSMRVEKIGHGQTTNFEFVTLYSGFIRIYLIHKDQVLQLPRTYWVRPGRNILLKWKTTDLPYGGFLFVFGSEPQRPGLSNTWPATELQGEERDNCPVCGSSTAEQSAKILSNMADKTWRNWSHLWPKSDPPVCEFVPTWDIPLTNISITNSDTNSVTTGDSSSNSSGSASANAVSQ